MTLQESLEKFYQYKRTYTKRKSSKNYYDSLSQFTKYVGNDTEIGDLKQDVITKYQIHINESSRLKDGTKHCYIKNLRIFIRWLKDEYRLDCISYKIIRLPKMPKKDYERYTDSQIKMMYDTVKCSSEWITMRNRCILTVLLDTGIRREEVRLLKTHEIDFSNRIFYIHGKGAKDRQVPFSERTEHLLREYWNICPYKNSEYAFCSRYGKQLGADAVKQFLAKLSRKLPFDVSAHRLRHSFATDYAFHYLKTYGTSCAVELSMIMGHEETKTTEIYIHIAQRMIALENRYSRINSIDWKKECPA